MIINHNFLTILFFTCFMTLPAFSQTAGFSEPIGFSTPTTHIFGNHSLYLQNYTKLEFTDNLDLSSTNYEGYRFTEQLSANLSGKFTNTTITTSLGALYYVTENDFGTKNKIFDPSLALNANHVFNDQFSILASGSAMVFDDMDTATAASSSFKLHVDTRVVALSGTFDNKAVIIKPTFQFTYKEYDFESLFFSRVVERDEYQAIIKIGHKFEIGTLFLFGAAINSQGSTESFSDVETERKEIGVTFDGTEGKLGYSAKIFYSDLSYTNNNVKDQNEFFGIAGFSYKLNNQQMIRFQYDRSFIDDVLEDAAGYVQDKITFDTQYNINSGLYIRPNVTFTLTEEIDSAIHYDAFALGLTVGKRILHNISLSLSATQTYENASAAAIDSGYTNYRETKASIGVTASF